ncbi:ABC transporter ATP-binding protein [Streptomyces sp. NPDC093060]|uniref:ABC transporter ATP-binding protein n=1 Tax=Streptomyces sp. NPDC093060 TaxID=3366019 RepID=UPI003821058E
MASDADVASTLRATALRRLAGRCLRHHRVLTLALAGAVGSTASSVAVPLLTRVVLDDVVVDAVRPLGPWVTLLLMAALARYGLTFLRRHFASRLAADVQHDLRTAMFRAVSRPEGTGADRLGPGQLMGRATSDLNVVYSLVVTLPALLTELTTLVAVLVAMTVLSVPLTLVSLAMAPALWALARRSHPRMLAASWRAQDRTAAVAGVVQSSVAGVQLVKGHGQERQETARFTAAARELYAVRLRLNRLIARYQPALQAVPALAQVAALFLGGWLAVHGRLSLGAFVAFSMYLTQLAGPVSTLAGLVGVVQQGAAAVGRVLDVTDAGPRHADGALGLPGDGPLAVEFDGVGFRYEPDRAVLDGLSLRIEPGETVAVVGGPGTGKSTLALLLARFHEAQSGAVRVGGTDVRDLGLDALRGALAVVPEETFLFAGSVRDNIVLGRPDADEDAVRAAARLARADEFVSALPDGYDTELSERGRSLSGGQRQRLALARALVTRPRLLILDDATSAVDPQVEAAICDGLRTLTHGRTTTLLIARRPSTLTLADRIAVLDKGRIVAVGTDPELRAHCPAYRALFPRLPDERTQLSDEPRPSEPAAHGPSCGPATPSTPTGSPSTPVPQPCDVDPAVDEEVAARELSGAFGLRELTRGFRWALGGGLVLVMADVVCGLAQPYAVRWGIQSTAGGGTTDVLAMACAAALVVTLLRWAVQRGSLRVTGRTGERLLYALRVRMAAQLHRLGLDHYEREADGLTLTRMTTDVDAVAGFLQTGLLAFLAALLTMAGVLVALLVADPVLLLVVLLALPALHLATAVFRRRSLVAYRLARERTATVNAALQESAEGMPVIQAFRQEDAFRRRFAAHSDAYRRARIRSQFLMALYFPFIECVAALAAAGVLAFGAQRVRDGSLDVGTLVAYLLYLELFFVPVQQISQLYDGFQQARVSLDRIGDLLRLRTSTPQREHPRPVGHLRGEIAFRDVCLDHPGRPAALAGVTLTITAGQRVAVVGETGSGKSTLLKLVPRFYDPTAGAVLVDGVDLRDLDLTAYRQRLGVVPQEPHLFAGTVHDAIAYGRPEADAEEVEAAARATGAHAVVATLPDGYRHRLTEGGRNLSAGQRQLIALARTKLADPAILLLDEATSALDPATEALVDAATDRLAARRTALIITHRLALAARADRVLVLRDGRVCEDGTHTELLALGGHYAALWRAHEAHPRTELQTQGRPL